MNEIEVRITRLHDNAEQPRYMSEHAAGCDLTAAIDEPLVVEPGKVTAVHTGLAIALPVGYEAQVRPRSGLALKHSIGVLNSPGTIDADYRGEVRIILYNFGDTPFTVEPGMRIAQMVVARCEQVKFVEVDKLDDTARGEGGFGHTKH